MKLRRLSTSRITLYPPKITLAKLLTAWLYLFRNSIHLVLPNNHNFFSESEVLRQLTLARQQRKILLAREPQIDLGLFQLRFGLGVDPDIALLDKVLIRDELILRVVANKDPVLISFLRAVENK